MLDNTLIAEIITLLNNGFATISSLVPNAPIIVQGYQPEQQGAVSAPAIYLFKVGPDTRLGWPERKNVWNQQTSQMVYTETQQYESMFQASCWATQSPSDTTGLTASDIANFGAYIMQSAATIAALEAMGCGIYRVGTVRNPTFSDDRDRFEFAPSFDFTITHKQIIQLTSPIVSKTVVQIDSV